MGQDVPVQSVRQEERGVFLPPLPFVLFRPLMDWMKPTHTGEGHGTSLSP